MTFGAFTSHVVVVAIAKAGIQKGNQRLDNVFLNSVFAGCLLAFTCGTVFSANVSLW